MFDKLIRLSDCDQTHLLLPDTALGFLPGGPIRTRVQEGSPSKLGSLTDLRRQWPGFREAEEAGTEGKC